MRKFMLFTVLIMAVFLSYTTAPAATLTLSSAEETALALEPPLTQTDIDAFITYGSLLIQASRTNNVELASTIFDRAGWNKIRSSYVVSKISNGYAINFQPQIAESMLKNIGMPAVLIPTATELELIKQNMHALDDIFGALTSSKP